MKLSIEDRIELLDGKDVWNLKGEKPFMVADGPHGLRKQLVNTDNLGINGSEVSIAFPTASLLACSFDKKVMKTLGECLAKEAKEKQVNVILGPGINIKRSPLCGRNFEYFSEDPYLTGELASSYVKSIESLGIGTSPKHFLANNQEKYRFFSNSIIDKRALNEIYLKAFKKVVLEKPATIMASYNKINGFLATENPIIKNTLRDKWGYEGVVVSDWGAVSNRVEALLSGIDLEMPSSRGYGRDAIKNTLNDNKKLEECVIQSSDRILKMIDKYQIKESEKVDYDKHHEIAVNLALESIVMLKNDSILPLNKNAKTAIIGGFVDNIRYQGGGSSKVNPYKLENISDIYQQYFTDCSIQKGYSIDNDLVNENLTKEALDIAKTSKQIIYLMGIPAKYESEGFDRENINLPFNQIKLLKELKAVNDNIVVVLMCGSVVDTSFKDLAKGIVLTYLGGEGIASAILKTLTGEVSPSGRLAETWINNLESASVKLTDDYNIYYDESIFVGYRYYSSFNIDVSYPFGFGLGYANISYSNFQIEENNNVYQISFDLINNSNIKQKEVIQVYKEVSCSSIAIPRLELVYFDKISLDKNEVKQVKLKISKDAFSHFDVSKDSFVIESNQYNLVLMKNVNEPIYKFSVKINGDFTPSRLYCHPWYLHDNSSLKEKFVELPPRKYVFTKPYSIDTPLFALRGTFIGKVMVNSIVKVAKKKAANDNDDFSKTIIEKTLLETPLRFLASFGSDSFNHEMAIGISLIASNKIFKGFNKLIKGYRKLKNERKSK